MNFGTLDGAIDCACLILTFGAFAFLAHAIESAGKSRRK